MEITKEWLQEMADSCAFSASAYGALRRDDLLNYFNGQRDVYLFLLGEMFGVRYDERVFPIDEDTKKKIIDSIFDNYKPYGEKKNT